MKKEGEITIGKLVFYNIIFFAPILLSLILSNWIGKIAGPSFDISPAIGSRILMIILTFIVFLIVIPYIRRHENVIGVRYALIGFLVVGIMMSIPSALTGDMSLIFNNLIYIAGYILLTFIFTPEVLGIDKDIHNYFERSKQLIVLVVYMSIVILYVLGFSHIYLEAYEENPATFNFGYEEKGDLSTFAYFSMITFSTIGYGDITPASNGTRLLASLQAILGMIINVIFIAILFLYISNIQSWIEQEEGKIKKEEKKIEREEKKIMKEEKEIRKLVKQAKKKK